MLKQLLNIWIKKKIRNFRWATFLLNLYFYILFLSTIVGFIFGADIDLGAINGGAWMRIVPILGASFIGFDFIVKLIFSRERALMDAFLSTRPVRKRTWYQFVFITTSFDLFNIAWTLPLAIGFFFFMPFGQALVSGLLILLIALANGLAATAFHTARGWEWRMALITGWLAWLIFANLYAYNLVGLSAWLHLSLFVIFAIGAIVLTIYYMTKLNVYVEVKNKAKLEKEGKGRSLYALEYRPFLRGKRLRNMFFFAFLFSFYAYLSLTSPEENSWAFTKLFYIPLSTMYLSAIYLQYVFAIEGNFFDGLWTRPVDIGAILLRKYRCSLLLSLVSLAIVLPIGFLGDVDVFFILSCGVFTMGCGNLIMLCYCFTSKRIDIFEKGMMNMQGANFSVQAFAAVSVCMGLPYLIIGFCPPAVIIGSLFAIGFAGFAFHKFIIQRIATQYLNNRYKHFERYRS